MLSLPQFSSSSLSSPGFLGSSTSLRCLQFHTSIVAFSLDAHLKGRRKGSTFYLKNHPLLRDNTFRAATTLDDLNLVLKYTMKIMIWFTLLLGVVCSRKVDVTIHLDDDKREWKILPFLYLPFILL